MGAPAVLTDVAIRNAKPRDKRYKVFDGKGLYLEVYPEGGRYWRLKYRIAGKEKRLAIGVYPEIKIARAREVALEARALVRQGLYPRLGSIPIARVTAVMLVDAVRPIEARGALEQAARALRWAKAICRYAVATGRLSSNPLSDVLASDVLEPRKTKSHPHLTSGELGDFLRQLHDYPGRPETRIAVQLLMLTFVRTGELRAAQWHEFDLERREWRIPAARMKMRAPHLVPLSACAMTLLKELREFSGYSGYLFPNHGKHPYMSENTINKAIANLGYKGRVVGHGFRATASTILNESGLFSPDIIERQLAHKEQNEIRAAYHRAEYLADRAKMMHWWADFLDAKHRGGKVIALRRGA